MEERYQASMILAAVGDAMGYKNGEWEFNFLGEVIHKEVEKLGGVDKLKIALPTFRVSDDTVLLLSTAESLIEVLPKKLSKDEFYSAMYKEFAFRYQRDFVNDMDGRAAGFGTGSAVHMLRPLRSDGWIIPFNNRGGGCGAAMRAMCIGLCYPNITDVECFENLIRISVESGRMTHNHPTGYLGSYATALFAAFSIIRLPVKRWGSTLVRSLPCVWRYVEQAGRDVEDNKKAWNYFTEKWTCYLEQRGIQDGTTEPVFPENYGIKERDAFYKSLSFSGWGGASGHDAPIIAYDSLLAAKDNWVKLCHHGMLHGGDNDSTGVIAGFCYGAMHGFKDVKKCNYQKVEKRDRLEKSAMELLKIAMTISQIPEEIPDSFDSVFDAAFK